MKKIRIKKGAIASAVVVAAATSAMYIPISYAATAVDVGHECSLTLKVEATDFLADLQKDSSEDVVANVYKIGTVSASGTYTLLKPYEKLQDSLDDALNAESATAEEWVTLADEAESIARDKDDAAEQITLNKDTMSGTGDKMETGLYLISVGDDSDHVFTDEYTYEFSPYVISLPTNYFYSNNVDEWVYDVTSALKAERTKRYGAIEIVKSLSSYNETLGPCTFAFQIEATKNGESVYSNVVSIDFSKPGEKTAYIDGIPAGAQVTVTEIYSGSSYKLDSEPTQTVDRIIADEWVDVPFENSYDDRLIPGNGVDNHFSNNGNGGWEWSVVDNSASQR